MSKILDVFIKDGINFETGEVHKVRVSDNFNVKVGDVVIIDPKYKDTINLSLGIVNYVDEVTDNNIDDIHFINMGGERKSVIVPFFISTLNLDEYVKCRERIAKKNKIEKQLNEATKKLEKVAKYKALADLNPEYKPLYDEYLSILTEDTKKLLDN